MGSKVGKILKMAAPLALSAAFPGVGTALGTALGAEGTAAGALGSGLIGAGTGALTGGGLKGALLGGAGGALGGYAGSGGFNGTSIGDLLGNPAGTPLGGGFQGPTQGSGILGSAQTAGSGLSNLFSGGGESSYALPALGVANSLYSNYEAQKKLKSATDAANSQLNPYLQAGAGATGKLSDFLGLNGGSANASDIIAASPQYKFAQQQGEQALERSQAARGGLFSGGAGKELANYTNGLATQASNDYYNKLAGVSGQGLGAAGQYGNNTTAMGTAGAAAQIASGNILSQLLAGNRRFKGYDASGNPLYA